MLLPFTVQQEQGSRYLYFASVGSSLVIAWSLRAAVTDQRLAQHQRAALALCRLPGFDRRHQRNLCAAS
jgi:hypothetical protein